MKSLILYSNLDRWYEVMQLENLVKIWSSLHFLIISPKLVLELIPNLHPVVFLLSIGLELLSSWESGRLGFKLMSSS